MLDVGQQDNSYSVENTQIYEQIHKSEKKQLLKGEKSQPMKMTTISI